jgi:alginate O-acetyltransferase complex protein AlgI
VNLFIVWFITGLWHGASFNFILWGLYYGFILCLEKFFIGKILSKLPSVIGWVYSAILVVTGWVIFRVEHWISALGIIKRMFIPMDNKVSAFEFIFSDSDLIFSILIIPFAIFGMFPVMKKIFDFLDGTGDTRFLSDAEIVKYETERKLRGQEKKGKLLPLRNAVGIVIYIGLFYASVVVLLGNTYNPFIYFRF